jgi:hypothetical protein
MGRTNPMSKSSKYTFTGQCYGFPVTLEVRIKLDRALWREEQRVVIPRERYCRACLGDAMADLRKRLVEELKKLGKK